MNKFKLVPKPKIKREIKAVNLLGEEKQILAYPIRLDTGYIVLKASQASLPIEMLYPELCGYFERNGFTLKRGSNDSYRWSSSYNLSVYLGKTNQFHTFKSLKIQMEGQFLVYRNAQKYARKIAKDIQEIGTKAGILIDISMSRADPSFLVIADDVFDIFPKPEDKILIANNMRYEPHFYNDGSGKISGITYYNSRHKFKIYDKGNDLIENWNKYSKDYREHNKRMVKEANRLEKKLFRIELESHNETHLFDYAKTYFGKDWEIEDTRSLKEIFTKFIKYHSFRQMPEGQEDELDRRNRGRWKEDPITNILFFGERKSKVKHLESIGNPEFSYKLHRLSRVPTVEQFIKLAAKDLARIDPNLDTCSLNFIKSEIVRAYNEVRHEVEENYKERILRQTSFRLFMTEDKKQIELIEREKKLLLAKMNVKEDPIFAYRFCEILKRANKSLAEGQFLHPAHLALSS